MGWRPSERRGEKEVIDARRARSIERSDGREMREDEKDGIDQKEDKKTRRSSFKCNHVETVDGFLAAMKMDVVVVEGKTGGA